jgi:hypothetical protein
VTHTPIGKAGLVLGGLILIAVAGCDNSDPEPSPSSTAAVATSVPLPSYCEVQGLRQLIADGTVQLSDLPASADLTEIDGTPRIIDFTQRPSGDPAAMLDELFAAPGLKGVIVPRDYRTACITNTTEADVENSQGGPGYLSSAD